jgi:hypothetical protein
VLAVDTRRERPWAQPAVRQRLCTPSPRHKSGHHGAVIAKPGRGDLTMTNLGKSPAGLVGAALLALGLAACGGSTQVKTVTVPAKATATASAATSANTVTATPTSTTPTTPPTPVVNPNDNCEAKGIDAQRLRQGSCKTKGTAITVVNSDRSLGLKSLTLRINRISTSNSLSDGSGQSAIAHGRFVTVNVTVGNRADSAQTFDGVGTQQTQLFLSKDTFNEDFEAENGPDQNSCLWNAPDAGIQPEETQTCDVVFDVPSHLIGQIDTTGNLDVINFGDDLSSPTGTIGVIRTYHPAVPIG